MMNPPVGKEPISHKVHRHVNQSRCHNQKGYYPCINIKGILNLVGEREEYHAHPSIIQDHSTEDKLDHPSVRSCLEFYVATLSLLHLLKPYIGNSVMRATLGMNGMVGYYRAPREDGEEVRSSSTTTASPSLVER